MITYASASREAIEKIYADPRLDSLADRLDETLEAFESDPGAARFRRHRTQHDPALFWFSVAGSGQTVTVLWEPTEGHGGFVHFVGTGLA